jgi:5-methylcytosine-specific restriction endonuclease McrA
VRQCRICGEELPLDKFYRDRSSPGGFRTACKSCHIVDVLRRQREKADEYAAYQAAYRAAHREEAKQTTARYRAANPEHIRATQDQYRARPENRATARTRAQTFRLANPERRAEYERRRRAAKTAVVIGFVTADRLAAKVAYWANRCWICFGEWDQFDHVKPLSKGGAHILANLRPVCGDCNRRKSNKWPFALKEVG